MRRVPILPMVKVLRMAHDEIPDPVLWPTPEKVLEEQKRLKERRIDSRDRGDRNRGGGGLGGGGGQAEGDSGNGGGSDHHNHRGGGSGGGASVIVSGSGRRKGNNHRRPNRGGRRSSGGGTGGRRNSVRGRSAWDCSSTSPPRFRAGARTTGKWPS